MGRDNHPKVRQLERTATKNKGAGYERILIVTEGSKTEPLYFEEICHMKRLHSAKVRVRPSELGTAPIQVVEYAKQLFEQGDKHKHIPPNSFDRVYAVFDRDEHLSYFDALTQAKKLDGKLKNDEKQPVPFKAIASIPNFELWLLLHYENIQAPITRQDVIKRLKTYIPSYAKGMKNIFNTTHPLLDTAMQHAESLANRFNANTAPEPFTDVFELIKLLTTLRT